MKKLILLTTLITALGFNSKGSHNLGGEITYEWVSTSMYNVKLILYTDCMGPGAPTSAFMDYNSASSCSPGGTVGLFLTSWENISQVCDTMQLACNGGILPGVIKTVYEGTITAMSPCPDWVLSYDVCCRNNAPQNVSAPGSTVFYIEATLDNTSNLNNKSPYFADLPRMIIPVNQTSHMNAGAYDFDGDSLHFSMFTPLSAAGAPVAYQPGYSVNEPFVSSPGTSINSQTGIITTHPTVIGAAMIAVKVDEFRNGQYIGYVMREFNTSVINNPNTLPSLLNTPLTYGACTPDTLLLDLYSADATDTMTTRILAGAFNNPFFTNTSPSPYEGDGYLLDTNNFYWDLQGATQGKDYITYINVIDNQCSVFGIQSYAVIVHASGCDSVWPGDANSDFNANVYDLLPIGVYYNNTGAPRVAPTNNWIGQFATDWGTFQATNTDIKHVDCNGDGTIDAIDTNAILLNYGLTHNKGTLDNSSKGVNDPMLYVDMVLDTVPTSTPMIIPIKLGTVALPADSVYGIAMTITYDKTLIDSIAGITVDYSTSWLGTQGVDMITLDTNFYDNGRIDIGLVRTDGQMMNGFDNLFTLGIVTADNLSGKTFIYDTLIFDFDNVVIINNAEDLRAFNQQADSIVIEDGTNGIDADYNSNMVHIVPNPNKGSFNVHITDFANSTVEIYNAVGQLIETTSSRQNGYVNIDMRGANKGMYFVRVLNNNKATKVEKVVIH